MKFVATLLTAVLAACVLAGAAAAQGPAPTAPGPRPPRPFPRPPIFFPQPIFRPPLGLGFNNFNNFALRQRLLLGGGFVPAGALRFNPIRAGLGLAANALINRQVERQFVAQQLALQQQFAAQRLAQRQLLAVTNPVVTQYQTLNAGQLITNQLNVAGYVPQNVAANIRYRYRVPQQVVAQNYGYQTLAPQQIVAPQAVVGQYGVCAPSTTTVVDPSVNYLSAQPQVQYYSLPAQNLGVPLHVSACQ